MKCDSKTTDITSIKVNREVCLYILGLIKENRIFCIYGLLEDLFHAPPSSCPYSYDVHLLNSSVCPSFFDFFLISPHCVWQTEVEKKEDLLVKKSSAQISEVLCAHFNGPWINGHHRALPFYMSFLDDKKEIVQQEILKDRLQPCLINNSAFAPSLSLPLMEEDECDPSFENEFWWFSWSQLKKIFQLEETAGSGLDVMGGWFDG